MTPNDKITSYIRTGVPYAIGALLAWILANTALNLTGEFQVALVAFTVPVAQNGYYLIVRVAETRVPALGIFLGIPAVPAYAGVDNLWASVVRTGIPTLVGALIVTALSALGLHLDADTQSGTIVVAVGVVSALYYSAAQALVVKWPKLVVLLGTAAAPSYATYTPKHQASQ